MIPKTGTNTVRETMRMMGHSFDNAHRPYSQLKTAGRVFAASIRHPEDRLMSSIHHSLRNSHFDNLDDMFNHVLTKAQENTQIWRPQSEFVSIGDPVKLFPFEGMPIVRWVGWTGPIPHLNSIRRRLPVDDIRSHPMYGHILSKYDADWELYAKATGK
jgi:hypothetical protein